MTMICCQNYIMHTSFLKNQPEFPKFTLNGEKISTGDNMNLLGVAIQNNLSWDIQTNHMISRASKRVYMLYVLKQFDTRYTRCIFALCLNMPDPCAQYHHQTSNWSYWAHSKEGLSHHSGQPVQIVCRGFENAWALLSGWKAWTTPPWFWWETTEIWAPHHNVTWAERKNKTKSS